MAKKKRENRVRSGKYILSVGDEGAVLVLMSGKVLVERHFIESPTSGDLARLLHRNKTLPIYLFVDVLDQAFIQHALPPVSALNIGQLVKRRLEKDFANEDIKAARKLYREKTGRKDWNYSFVSVHNAPPFSDWLQAVLDVDNPFKGIFLLPIESEKFVVNLYRAFVGKKKPAEWQILVSHNKVGGFRQIVYRDGKVVFTRIAQPIGGQAPDVIAGNIEQETLNTVEYVRRLGFDNDENLDIFIIASKSVKTALETNALRARQILILTPYEISEKMGFINTSEKTDRFGDIVLAAAFANVRPLLKFNSKSSKVIDQLVQLGALVTGISAIIVPIILFMTALSIYNIIGISGKIDEANLEKNSAQQQLDQENAKRGEMPEDAEHILEAVNTYKTLTKENDLPFKFVSTFSGAKPPQVKVSRLLLEVDESYRESNFIRADMDLNFENPSKNIDRLLEDLDSFTQSIRTVYKDYVVSFSGLPEQSTNLSLEPEDASGNKKVIKITIEGPGTPQTVADRKNRIRR